MVRLDLALPLKTTLPTVNDRPFKCIYQNVPDLAKHVQMHSSECARFSWTCPLKLNLHRLKAFLYVISTLL